MPAGPRLTRVRIRLKCQTRRRERQREPAKQAEAVPAAPLWFSHVSKRLTRVRPRSPQQGETAARGSTARRPTTWPGAGDECEDCSHFRHATPMPYNVRVTGDQAQVRPEGADALGRPC